MATPLVTLQGLLFDDLKLTGSVQGTDYGEVTTSDELQVLDDQNTLSAGLRGTLNGSTYDHLVQVSTAGGRFWGVPSSSAVGLNGLPVALSTNTSQAAVFGYDTNATMVGLLAPARRVGFFADQATVRSFTAEGWALFDAAVDWAASPVLDSPQVTYGPQLAPSANSVALSWYSTTTNLTHDIERSIRPGGPYIHLTTLNTPGTPDPELGAKYTYTDSAAVTGQTYYYVITPGQWDPARSRLVRDRHVSRLARRRVG